MDGTQKAQVFGTEDGGGFFHQKLRIVENGADRFAQIMGRHAEKLAFQAVELFQFVVLLLQLPGQCAQLAVEVEQFPAQTGRFMGI